MLGGIIPCSRLLVAYASSSPSPSNSGVSRLARRASVTGGPFSYPRSQCHLPLRIFSHELDLGATPSVGYLHNVTPRCTTASRIVRMTTLRSLAGVHVSLGPAGVVFGSWFWDVLGGDTRKLRGSQ